ncbi:hypothetical protein LCGC14_0997060 [marine sediment metagenome]|uniref:Uncharacterized protein n=1 Tax=marine sediment metagenome TaxID=412755 RepID=A0A0F9NQP7_9ZZZZ
MLRFSNIDLFKADGIVHIGPCSLISATIAGNGANAQCDIYDGVDANGKVVTHLEALDNTTFHADLDAHPILYRGIYLDVNATTTEMTIEWIPLTVKEVRQGHFDEVPSNVDRDLVAPGD